MATTPKGLFYPDETTNITPLHTVLGAMQTSTDNLLTGRGTAFATTGDRDTAIPSPSAGMIVTTGTGSSQILWVYSGSAWVNTYTLPTWYADTTARDAAITSPAAGMIAATGTGTGYVLWNYTGSAWARVTPEEAAPMPRSRGAITANFDVPTGAYTRITGFTEEYDVGSMFNPTTGIVTIPANGVYAVTANLVLAFNATGRRILLIEKGTAAAGSNTGVVRWEGPPGAPSPTSTGMVLSSEATFAAGDQLALVAFQSSGGVLSALATAAPISFTCRRVA